MSYVDVETSAEALQEEEELIEAVNEMVETAAAAIYTDIKNDVSGVVLRIRYFMEAAFPFLMDWRQDPTAFGRDMKNLGLAFLLYLVAFWMLAPSRRWTIDGNKRRRHRHSLSGDKRTIFGVLKRTLSPFRQRKDEDETTLNHNGTGDSGSSGSSSSPRRRPTLERSRSTSSIVGMNNPRFLLGFDFRRRGGGGEEYDEEEEEEETEEQKFAKRWPEILQTRYCQLVLPPECKRVEKPKKVKKLDAEARLSSVKKIKDDSERNEGGPSDDENPAQRLVNYTRHFLHLMMSFLRYDYMGAGYSLINWIEWWVRNRRNRQTEVIPSAGTMEDDESEAGDHGSGLVRQLSFSSINSVNSNASNSATRAPDTPNTTRNKMRSKRDSILRSSKRLPNASSQGLDATGSNDATDSLPNGSLTTVSSREGEEKKEVSGLETDRDDASFSSNGMSTPPPTPSATNRSSNPEHPDTVYETPRLDLRDQSIDLGDALVPKLALSSRSSGHSISALPKPKDALESYRNPVLRAKSTGTNGNLPGPPAASPARLARLESFGDGKESSNHGSVTSTHEPSLLKPASVMNHERAESKTFYFEAATSQDMLKKMAVEIPVPDRNGYIVGDEFLPDASRWKPLLVFVNSRSGPQQGHLLIAQLRGLLNPIQVWDLADGGPEEILESFTASFSRLRILVCGGDGTVSWIVSTMENMKLQRTPAIAILPLGTGNDLARIHGWGGGYNNESLTAILEQVSESYISWLDRWEMTIENKKGKVKQVKCFFNYLGVGADAQAALQVHLLRESRPQLFFSRVVNKAWYGVFGAEDILKATSVNLPHEITLIADGVEVPLPPDSQGIILLNIDSYAGGVPLWSLGSKGGSLGNSPMGSRRNSWNGGKMRRSHSLDMIKEIKGAQEEAAAKASTAPFERVDSVEDLAAALALTDEEKYMRVTACDRPSSCQDGFLDVVSIRGAFHLGQIRVGLSNAQKVCQCREATIIIKRKVSVQIDGEPWRQNVCTLRVKRKKDAAIMLHRSADDSNGVETEMANLLEWAEEKKLIDDRVHAALMKEFSRRIESKTRQRREQNHRAGAFSLKRAMGSTGNLGGGGPSSGIMF